MIVSQHGKHVVAVAGDAGAFVDIDLAPTHGIAHVKVWDGIAGPVLAKTLHKRDADYKATVKLYDQLRRRA